MPVYEIIANSLIFAILWQLRKRNWVDGRLFLVYLILYSTERFFLAFTSSYRIAALGLTQLQIIAVFGLTIGLSLLGWMSGTLNKPLNGVRTMEDNCYVEPIYKNAVSPDQLQQADYATLVVWGMGCQNCVTRVRNSLLALEGVFGVDVYLNMALAEVIYDGKNSYRVN